MGFTPDRRPRGNTTPEKKTGERSLAAMIMLLTGALAAEPVQAAPSAQSEHHISVDKGALAEDERDIAYCAAELKQGIKLLSQAEHEQGGQRLTILVEAAQHLSIASVEYGAATEALHDITVMVVGDPTHTPEMDLSLITDYSGVIDEGGRGGYSNGWAIVDGVSLLVNETMNGRYPLENIDKLNDTSDGTLASVYEEVYQLANHDEYSSKKFNQPREIPDMADFANRLGEFNMHFTVVNISGAPHRIIPTPNYYKADEYFTDSGNTEAVKLAKYGEFRQTIDWQVQSLTYKDDVLSKRKAMKQFGELYASGLRNIIQAAGLPQEQVKTELAPFYQYLETDPNHKTEAMLNDLVSAGK